MSDAIIYFKPHLLYKSDEWNRAWELLKETELWKSTVIGYSGNMNLRLLSFERKEDAMMFRLRL